MPEAAALNPSQLVGDADDLVGEVGDAVEVEVVEVVVERLLPVEVHRSLFLLLFSSLSFCAVSSPPLLPTSFVALIGGEDVEERWETPIGWRKRHLN